MTTLKTEQRAQAVSPLAALLKDYLERHDLSMRALALRAGCHEKAVGQIIRGRIVRPNRLTLERLANATGIPLEQLIAGPGAEDPNGALFAAVRRGRFMSDVIAAVETSDLKPAYRREVVRDVERVCREWLHRKPAEVPADARWLAERLESYLPAALGLSRKRFANIKSSLNRALEIGKAKPQLRAPIEAVGPVWWALFQAIPDVPDVDRRTGEQKRDARGRPKFRKTHVATALSPFIRYCDQRGILPEDVTDAILDDYAAFRDRIDLARDVGSTIGKVRRSWNTVCETVPGWPDRLLTAGAAESSDPVVLPAAAFPESLQAELRSYEETRGMLTLKGVPATSRLAQLRARIRAPSNGPGYKRRKVLEPLSERVTREHSWTLRYFASAMIRLGRASPDDFQSIADVAEIGLAIDVMEHDVKQRIGLKSSYAGELVKKLSSVARRWVPEVDAEELDAFSELRSVVEADFDTGVMSDRDRDRLAPFLNNPDNMALLVSLPMWIVERSEDRRRRQGKVDQEMARAVQGAIAMLIEQTLPVRWIDLRSTKVDKNIIWPVKEGLAGTLHYRPSKSQKQKNAEVKALQAKLEPWKMRLLTIYRRHYLPQLPGGASSPYLFPGEAPGSCKSHAALARLVGGLVEDTLGYKINPHLWRKLMGGYLLLQTGNMALVELLLGHSPNSGATEAYVEIKSAWAAAELDQHVARLAEGRKPPRHLKVPWEKR